MVPKSGNRFSDKAMLKQESMIPEKPAPELIRGGHRFSDRVMPRQRILPMLARTAIVSGLLCIAVAAATPASAQAELAPIVICPAKEHPNCQIYLKADGARLLFKGNPISASGTCPSDFLRETVTRFGASSYRLKVSGADCIITTAGLG